MTNLLHDYEREIQLNIVTEPNPSFLLRLTSRLENAKFIGIFI